MFGQNKVVTQAFFKPGYEAGRQSLLVREIFKTIQGEGPRSGTPAIFVRLAGCNLRCTFCDTDFEPLFSKSFELTELLAHIESLKTHERLVVITGGEPFLQPLKLFVSCLLIQGFSVDIETAGTVAPYDGFFDSGLVDLAIRRAVRRMTSGLPALNLICSPKTPAINSTIAKYTTHFKYVIVDGQQDEDGLPLTNTQLLAGAGPSAPLYKPTPIHRYIEEGRIFLSPCDEKDTTLNENNIQAVVDACLKHGYKFSLQTHKITGVR